MIKSLLPKDFFRGIWEIRSRFFAVLSIAAIGCSFFSGVKSISPDMRETAEKYFKSQKLMDFQLKSTKGFSNNEIKAIKANNLVKDISFGYSEDFFVDLKTKSDILIKAYSYNKNESINKPVLKKGRLPKAENECLSEDNISLGDTITLNTDTGKNIENILTGNKFTVVGIVESPLYISFDRGTSKLGNGKINSFIYIPEKCFKYEFYTDIFVTSKNTVNLSPFLEAYEDKIREDKKSLEETAETEQKERYTALIEEMTGKLNVLKAKLKENEDRAANEQFEAEKKIKSSKAELEKGKLDYTSIIDKQNSEITTLKLNIEKSETELGTAQATYNAEKSKYDIDLADYEKNLPEANKAIEEATKITQELTKALSGELKDFTELLAMISNLDNTKKEALTTILTDNQIQDEEKKPLSDIISQIETETATAQNTLNETKQQLDITNTSLDTTRASIESGFSELEKNKAELSVKKKEGQRILDEALKKLNVSEGKILNAEAELNRNKLKAEEETNNAKIEIANAEKEISELENPKPYIFDRKTNPGYEDYKADVQRVKKFVTVFPVFFIIVAALVYLTAIAKMVGEQRTVKGNMRSLGYVVLASVSGSIIGLLIGFKLFPVVIFSFYKTLYILPEIYAPFRIYYAFLCIFTAIVCTSLLVFSARFVKSRFVPSLQIKKRVIMSAVGIAGCTALLLTGFGLRHSVSSTTDKQFIEILHYDLSGETNEDITQSERELINTQLSSNEYIKSSMSTYKKTVLASNDGISKELFLFVPESPKDINEYITLKNRKTNDLIFLNNSSAVITEKMARLLSLKVNDSIYVEYDETKVSVKIGAITENYIDNFLYITPEYYKKLYGNLPKYNFLIAKTAKNGNIDRETLSSSLLKNKNILGISYINDNSDKFKNILKSLDLIVLFFIFSSRALALIVLYNSEYIYRENIKSAVFGIITGLVIGIPICLYVISTAGIDSVMFTPTLDFFSFLYAIAFIFFFAAVINLIRYWKLRTI